MESFGFCPYWHVVVLYNNAEPFQPRVKEARERAVLLCNPGACATHLRCYIHASLHAEQTAVQFQLSYINTTGK